MKTRPFENLDKATYWDKIAQDFPKAFKIFRTWIDEYKAKVKWKTMFFVTKFHDIPVEMQYGIMLQFICERNLTDVVYMNFVKGQTKAIKADDFKKKLIFLFEKLEKQQ